MTQKNRLPRSIFIALLFSLANLFTTGAIAANGIYINEIQVSTSGSDWEFFELQGAPGTDLSDLTLIGIESDFGSSTGRVDRVISLAGQVIPADGFWLGINSTGESTYGVTGDLLIGENSFENGTATYFLVVNFTGTAGDDLDGNDDGVLDSTPWDAVADSLNIRDSGASDFDYGAPSVGPDGPFLPSGTFRCPDAPAGTFAGNILNFSTPNGTPGYRNFQTCGLPDVYLNEIQVSTTGSDWEFFELQGAPGTDLSDLTLIGIESDFGSSTGRVDRVISLAGQVIPADGFWLGINSTGESTYGVTGDLLIGENSFENGTATYFLVVNFTGTAGDDLDGNDDGVLDSAPWDAVADSLNIRDSGASDFDYGAPSVGPDGPFLPSGTFRCPDAPAGTFAGNILSFSTPNGTPGITNGCGVVAEACGEPYTPIFEVQGVGSTSPLQGSVVSVEGIVVGDFQNNGLVDSGDLDGFHVQDPAGDGDPASSDGIFVYAPGALNRNVGDAVRVRGNVSEYFGQTQISASQIWLCSAGNAVPDPEVLSLPVDDIADFEAFEGMRVTFPQDLYIAEYYNFDRFGEIFLASERLFQPTAVFEPDSLDMFGLAELNAASQILLDDGRTSQNPDPAIHPNGSEFNLGNLFRGGDILQDVTGVMDYAFGRYRIQPTQGATHVVDNPRPAVPDDVGGDITVAAFNVLNYFNGDGFGGGFPTSRGADTPEEFTRQRDKIIAAIAAIDADVIGLVEIENDGYDQSSAIQDLVNGLNDATAPGTYDFVDPDVPAIGTDEIAVALLYKPAMVSLQGPSAILDSSVDPDFNDDFNRPALAQTFAANANGGVFTVVVNHLKSKGSNCNDLGDPDTGDGQGNCNLTRTAAAEALVEWLAGDPTGAGDGDYLVIGDLNSYDKEDPIDVFLVDGYADLLAEFGGEFAYSYLFSAQLGYLDYALASPVLSGQVSGATAWHINADEPDLIDYDMTFKKDAQDAIYAPDAYRSSDHDPVIVGLSPLHFEFDGFYPPIKAMPAVNKAKAGSSVPVKFSLDGDYGLDIFAAGYPLSQAVDCDSGDAEGDPEPTHTAGGSMLTYDADEDQYVYVWQSEVEWKGSCRQLVVQLIDGAIYRADFRFK